MGLLVRVMMKMNDNIIMNRLDDMQRLLDVMVKDLHMINMILIKGDTYHLAKMEVLDKE